MQTNNHKTNDFSAFIAQKYGKEGTPEREKFDDEAYAFYTSQLILDARKEAKITQSELASKINSTKSYISQIEHGSIIPSVSVFYRIINALGMRVEIVKPIGI
ncbi:MAG: helix-turn-helix transcriptional regulator [Prevotella sp.]|nr:helix-turn-helix transcriptional regulator [Prevotella sp.]MCF0208501.1 helix-turn-helix transcriptional regulator [Bacteroidaceae bacterium]